MTGNQKKEREDKFTTKKGGFVLYDKNGKVIMGKEPKKKDTQK